jgi:hypothetical protein
MNLARVLASVLAGSLAFGVTSAQSPRPLDTSAKAVTRAAFHYVDDYEKQLSFLLADEDGLQRSYVGGLSSTPRKRTTKAEVFLTFLDADRMWLTVRDVTEVDGQPLEHKKDLRALLTAGPVLGLARTLAQENSRFNIGRIYRNFNEPTLGLLVLDAKHRDRFKFDRKKVESSAAGPLVTLAFTEKKGPTLIHSANGQEVFAKGEVVIEAATGRVRETQIEITTDPVHAKLATRFVEDARLAVWVPDTLTEIYTDQVNTQRSHETTVCESKYTNYRRFEVQVRIK